MELSRCLKNCWNFNPVEIILLIGVFATEALIAQRRPDGLDLY
jgi:hypothetical protein